MKQRILSAIYSREFREQAVKLITDEGMSSKEAARRLSLPVSTFGYWLKAAQAGKLGEVGKAQRPLTEVELELAKAGGSQNGARPVKKSGSVLCQRSAVSYAMMKELQENYPVPFMCRIYEVSPSGYYAWLGRPPSKRAQDEVRLEVEIRAAHQRTRETYGPERLQEYLAENGINTSVHHIKRIRRKLGIRCKQKRKFKATTNTNHAMPVAPNLLEQKFTATAPNQIWVSDITCIPTDEGWLYLAGHKDLFSGDLVGHAMNERMTKNLVSQSLFRGVAAKRPPRGVIHHSDRGSQYCAHEYSKLLGQFGMVASMSRRGTATAMHQWIASGDC